MQPFSQLSIGTFRLVHTIATPDTRPEFARNPIKAPSVRLQNSYFIIEPFSFTVAWPGASYDCARGQFGDSNWFTIQLPITKVSNTFVPCVMWVDPNTGNVIRYKLWKMIGEVLPYPTYTGQGIPPGAYLEIWTVQGQNPLLPMAWNLLVGNMVAPATCQLSPSTGPAIGDAGVSQPFLSPYPTLSQLLSG